MNPSANIRRFHAPTAREALAHARMALGEEALILSNRSTAHGVEIMATTEAALQAMGSAPDGAAPGAAPKRPDPAPARAPQRMNVPQTPLAPPPPTVNAHQSVQQDVAQLAMSTLSFQDYVRERMLRRRHEVSQQVATQQVATQQAATAQPPAPSAAAASARRAALVPHHSNNIAGSAIYNEKENINEFQDIKNLINERFNTLTWLGQTRQNTLHTTLLHKLLRSGYSPALARTLLQHLPADVLPSQALRWLMQALQRNLRTDAGQPSLDEAGGTYALLGTGGSGKTASAAKLAALCAQQHGAASVGLIALGDAHGTTHLQLRHSARALGISAHSAHDRASLQDLLGLLSGKRLVLIDTPGLPARDPRHAQLHALLDLPGVQPLLAVNAASQSENLDELLRTGKHHLRPVFQGFLTRVDEAVKLAPVLDACIRHRLLLRACACGPRPGQDWQRADSAALVAASMRASARSAFDLQSQDVDFCFLPATGRDA